MKRILLSLVAVSCLYQAIACTTFFLNKNGQMVFGRNYDWVTETGVVHTNLRGLQKTSLDLEQGNVVQWVSQYGSLTFNQYGKEFPNGGMNEKGLVVELMWLDESQFPLPDSRPAFSVLQWIQYQLDNCSTVEEVIATDKKIRITSQDAPQHYLVADGKGHVATIEFLKGKMSVHTGASLPHPVLANSTYEASLEAVNKTGTQKDSLHFTDNSLQRFNTACNLVQQVEQSNSSRPLVEEAFGILENVAQPGFTKWSIVYDLTNLKVSFITANYKDRKQIDLKSFDFSCTAKPLSFLMGQNASGDINQKFIAYSDEANAQKLKTAFHESRRYVQVEETLQNRMAALAATVRCKQ